MATKRSDHVLPVNYVTSWRGRPLDGDMGMEMFPGKYEATAIVEDPYALYEAQRDILRDRSPDDETLFEYEETRRDKHSREILNLRHGGARVNTDPWASDDYDTQFHDHDPRGYLTEQPWDRHRELIEAQVRRTDFKDDGDYSVPSAMISPYRMQRNIKGAFYWIKNRMKIFSTSKDNFHNGGIGKYKWQHASEVPLIDVEDTSSMVDQRYMDAEGRINKSSILSNIVHYGSKHIRVNTTSDHEVKVAQYGMIRSHRGLIKHEPELRMVQSDHPQSAIDSIQAAPVGLSKLMSTAVEGQTSASAVRQMIQQVEIDKGAYAPTDISEHSQANRSIKLTEDIINLLGFTEAEVKWLESEAVVNRKHAVAMYENIQHLVEMVHAAPAHVKLEMRNQLILELSGAGAGMRPASATSTRRARDAPVVDPKIVDILDLMVRRTEKPGLTEESRRRTEADAEGKLNHMLADMGSVMGKMAAPETDKRGLNRRRALAMGDLDLVATGKVAGVYRALSRKLDSEYSNRGKGIATRDFSDTSTAMVAKARAMADDMRSATDNTTAVDISFRDGPTGKRHGAPLGTKYISHRTIDDRDIDDDRDLDDIFTPVRRA